MSGDDFAEGRWNESLVIGNQMFTEAGVEMVVIPNQTQGA
jgi:hypothetical protein